MPGTYKYQKAWEKDYTWVSSVRTDPQSPYCEICLKSFKISNSGLVQLKSHSKWHEEGDCSELEKPMDARFRRRTRVGALQEEFIGFINKEDILKAEILQALHMVEKNHSFASDKGDSDRFKLMFPDTTIAKGTSNLIRKFNM